MAEKDKKPIKFRPFSAERLEQTFKDRNKVIEALENADKIRPELMHQIVRCAT